MLHKQIDIFNFLVFLFLATVLYAFAVLLFPSNSIEPLEDGCCINTSENIQRKSTLASIKFQKGKSLFKAKCASCHNKNMKDDLTGPALAGYATRWAAYPKEDLFLWIKNSSKMIANKHPRALLLWKKYKVLMPSFSSLEENDIEAILLYIDEISELR